MHSEHQLLEVQDPDGNQYTIRASAGAGKW